jgi:hypothetical protein
MAPNMPKAYLPVISKSEPVTLVRCPTCTGSVFYSITRFLSTDDLNDLARLTSLGYSKQSLPLNHSNNIHDCECPPGTAKPSPAVRPAPTGKPVLSLGSNKVNQRTAASR